MRAETTTFPTLLQDFFVQRLQAQRGASPQTVASYRDAFALLLRFIEGRQGRTASSLTMNDLGASVVTAFLDHLEQERGNSPRTRNARLAAIRSFMRYASVRDPTSLPVAQQVLAIPLKRFDRPILGFLSRQEIKAILDAPDPSTWSGRRDAVLFATLYNTGARVSEIVAIQRYDIVLATQCSVRLHGKGRKDRTVPLWRSTRRSLQAWLDQIAPESNVPVFPNRAGSPLTRSGVEHRLRLCVTRAQQTCPSLAGRQISPHILRHTTAMHLLQSGVDITVIALWLGHEDPGTTHLYLEADMAMKEAALRRVDDPAPRRSRYRPPESLLAFLKAL